MTYLSRTLPLVLAVLQHEKPRGSAVLSSWLCSRTLMMARGSSSRYGSQVPRNVLTDRTTVERNGGEPGASEWPHGPCRLLGKENVVHIWQKISRRYLYRYRRTLPAVSYPRGRSEHNHLDSLPKAAHGPLALRPTDGIWLHSPRLLSPGAQPPFGVQAAQVRPWAAAPEGPKGTSPTTRSVQTLHLAPNPA